MKAYIFANTQYCLQHYVSQCFQFQVIYLNTETIGCTLKLLKFMSWYASRKFLEVLV
jgi:hypothetical protein